MQASKSLWWVVTFFRNIKWVLKSQRTLFAMETKPRWMKSDLFPPLTWYSIQQNVSESRNSLWGTLYGTFFCTPYLSKVRACTCFEKSSRCRYLGLIRIPSNMYVNYILNMSLNVIGSFWAQSHKFFFFFSDLKYFRLFFFTSVMLVCSVTLNVEKIWCA